MQGVHHVGAAVLGGQWAIGVEAAGQGGSVQPFAGHLLQGKLKGFELRLVNRAAGRHGMAAKAQQHIGAAFGDQVQRVPQMEPGNRAA